MLEESGEAQEHVRGFLTVGGNLLGIVDAFGGGEVVGVGWNKELGEEIYCNSFEMFSEYGCETLKQSN